MKNEMIEMWTAQADIVLDTINRDGIYYVKKEYIQQKYKETAWSFKIAYEYFSKLAEKKVERPKEAESPIWLFKEKKWAVANVGCTQLRLHIPKNELVLFDLRDWTKILSLSFLGDNTETKKFEDELRRQGIMASSDVFEKPYYPALKNKILKSWDKLLEKENLQQEYTQGAIWILKKKWIC